MPISGRFLHLTNISTAIKCSNKLILNNSGVLFHVGAINNVLLLYNNDISDQICIDISAEKDQNLPVVATKAICNALSAITELLLCFKTFY